MVISCGMHDLDTKSPNYVADVAASVYGNISSMYPELQLFVCEITPRADRNSICVTETNELLRQKINSKYLVCMDNLQDIRYFGDEKHLTKSKVPLLIGNIKNAIRKTNGLPKVNSDAR